ncbi:glycosyl hydrolase family 10 protein/carbohydrate-binding domain-containing protein [Abeliophyllum distichum]|uniref:Glycosyl hydrolase family 10 protein/carbohydrate-binding domain-containing protein n=1 Tax=Abeliophyllum distichum TaxID=126358 RepID=A0ABD1SG00_9LAMI
MRVVAVGGAFRGRSTKKGRVSKHSPQSQRSGDNMENQSTSNANNAFQLQNLNEELKDSSSRASTNIILNHDFSEGLHSWHPNCCDAFVISEESGNPEGIPAKLSGCYAVVTNRRECWQGLEQDITNQVSAGSTYTVCAWVGVSGAHHGVADVQATLKLEYRDSAVSYLFIGRIAASMERWEKVEGTFSLSTMPDRVVFYLEGPSPGVDLLIRSVLVSCSSLAEFDSRSTGSICDGDESIILNPRFDDGLQNWSGRGCKIVLHDSYG